MGEAEHIAVAAAQRPAQTVAFGHEVDGLGRGVRPQRVVRRGGALVPVGAEAPDVGSGDLPTGVLMLRTGLQLLRERGDASGSGVDAADQRRADVGRQSGDGTGSAGTDPEPL
jgi:hypothetical protein